MVNPVGPSTSVSHAPYSLPINASPLPMDAPPVEKDPLQDSKVQAVTGLISRMWNWFLQLFGFNTLPADDGTHIDTQSAYNQIEGVSRLQDHRKEILEDSFTDLTDIGIEKKFLELRIAQIGIQQTQNALNQEQILKLHDLIKETKDKIDEALQKQLNAAQYAKLFGKIEVGTSTLLIAVTVVSAAVAAALGAISGGTLAVAAAPAFGTLEIAVGIVDGATRLMNTGFKYKADRLSAELLGVKEKRKSKIKLTQDLIKQNHNAQESVNASWKQAQEIEEQRDKIIKGVLR